MTNTKEQILERTARSWVLAYYRQSGVFVMPVDMYNGKDGNSCPLLKQASGNAIILPDLFCAVDGTSWWVEVKGKSNILRWRNLGGRQYHGMNMEHLLHYRWIVQVTGLRVDWVVFEHETGCYLRIDDIANAQTHELGTGTINSGPQRGARMINFRRDQFTEIGRILIPVQDPISYIPVP